MEGLQESLSLIASQPFRETESYQTTSGGGGGSLIGVEELTIFIIPASCSAPVTAPGFGKSPGLVLSHSVTVHYPGFIEIF